MKWTKILLVLIIPVLMYGQYTKHQQRKWNRYVKPYCKSDIGRYGIMQLYPNGKYFVHMQLLNEDDTAGFFSRELKQKVNMTITRTVNANLIKYSFDDSCSAKKWIIERK